jgi:hypothetical protein
MKKDLILIFCLFIFNNCFSQTFDNKDSINEVQSLKSKFHQSLGFGVSNIEQKFLGPNTNLNSNVNVINLALNTNYKINERFILEGNVAALIGSSFNYYNYNSSLTNLYNPNVSLNFQRPINSNFTILSSSLNMNIALYRNKPNLLFFVPKYLFIGPKYDAFIGVGGGLKFNNNFGYQYGFKYKFGLKYLNIYPVVTISQSPNLYDAGTSLITNISNHYTSFSLYIESRGGIMKFKKYVAPPKLKFSQIPLFKWRE